MKKLTNEGRKVLEFELGKKEKDKDQKVGRRTFKDVVIGNGKLVKKEEGISKNMEEKKKDINK